MPEIVRVGMLDGDTLEIQLGNGNVILLQTQRVLTLDGFEGLWEDDRILYPRTDGENVFWRDGPRLSVSQLQELAFERQPEE